MYTKGVSAAPSAAIVSIFGATIFLGAFLLFQVQVVIAKDILPWYGGVPMVWATSMLCFQVLLLAGYAYAHLLVRLTAPRQRVAHLVVVVASLTVVAVLVARWGVPLLPDAGWKPDGRESPTWHIVRLLAVAVGAPFFVAATTSPLIQSWLAAAYPRSSPYRLYALSNLGSMLALLSYPALFEIWLSLRTQAWLWTAAYVVFCAGVVACAVVTRTHARVAASSAAAAVTPSAGQWLLWVSLAACASALLLATTNYVSQEIAVIPFLWIMPLALYLASFVLTFDSDHWYVRGAWATLLALGVTLSAFVLDRGVWAHVVLQIGVAVFTLFAACMVCHGELARSRPDPAYLTSFYVAITVGGALGGAAVSLVAPLIFPGTWEYPLGLWIIAVLALVTFARDRSSPLYRAPWTTALVSAAGAVCVAAYVFRGALPWMPSISDAWLFGTPAVVTVAGVASGLWRARRPRPAAGVPGPAGRARIASATVSLALVVVWIALARVALGPLASAREHSRSFYGIVHVEEVGAGREGHFVTLRHGRIVHGKQYRGGDEAREPTAYYGRDSGVGLAIEHHPRRDTGLRIGVVGLGVGTLAAYGEAGDTLRFYEINPDVDRLAGRAGRYFTFVRDTEAATQVVIGDARLALEAELARGEPQRFDVLAIDAFSSDAIPAHLLTLEAARVYLAHLDPGGILAIHITNRYIGLEPVIRGIAARLKLAHVFIASIEGGLTWRSDWALLARDRSRLQVPAIADARSTELSTAPVVVWTDDYSNVLSLLKW